VKTPNYSHTYPYLADILLARVRDI